MVSIPLILLAILLPLTLVESRTFVINKNYSEVYWMSQSCEEAAIFNESEAFYQVCPVSSDCQVPCSTWTTFRSDFIDKPIYSNVGENLAICIEEYCDPIQPEVFLINSTHVSQLKLQTAADMECEDAGSLIFKHNNVSAGRMDIVVQCPESGNIVVIGHRVIYVGNETSQICSNNLIFKTSHLDDSYNETCVLRETCCNRKCGTLSMSHMPFSKEGTLFKGCSNDSQEYSSPSIMNTEGTEVTSNSGKTIHMFGITHTVLILMSII